MFDKTATYQKSAAGAEAIATRSSALTPKLRTMLIMVDGKRGWDDLAKVGDAEQALPQLLQLGFIEPVAGTGRPAAPPASSAQAQPAAPPARPPFNLVEAKRFAARRLTDLMGPAAEDICIRIEATRTPQEFATAIQRAENLLRQFGSAQVAAKFSADMEPHRPA
jgi:hypothetical protein